MIAKTFHPFGFSSVILNFKCICGNLVESEEGLIPSPNLAADNNADSYNCDEYPFFAVCDNCDENYEIYIYSGMYDAYIQIEADINEDLIVINTI